MTDHQVQVWTLIATVVVAVGTLGAAVAAAVAASISSKAANAWRDGLKQQRADECIAAIENCAAAVGRTVSLKKSGRTPAHPSGVGLDEAWNQWAKLRMSIAVFAAYEKMSFDDLISNGVAIMDRLTGLVESSQYGPTSGDVINSEFGQLKSRIEKKISTP